MTTILRPAVQKDAEFVGPQLREIDALECAIALGLTGPEAVATCIRHSPIALAAYDGNPKEPFAVFGCAPLPGGAGCIWLLGTDVFDEHRKDMMRLTGRFIDQCAAILGSLVVQVAASNAKSIRFLSRFGFKAFPVMDLPYSPLIHLVRTANV